MKLDVFFSISQTPAGGLFPSEQVMFQNFFDQVKAADELGYETAWVAESHLSSEVQKGNPKPVIPHWQGEVGLNSDIFQMAHAIFAKTKKIEVGSAVMNILCNGGPIAAAERTAAFASIHGLDQNEKRRLHVGFAAGRFDFSSRATGIVPRNSFEDQFWPLVKGKIFSEAAEIYIRLLQGETLSSEDISERPLSKEDFRSEDEWQAAPKIPDRLPRRWTFEKIKIIPQDWRRELVQPVIGSHDPSLQEEVNKFAPVHVFNLSITKPEIIEHTHQRMGKAFHKRGGPWKRHYMPRTVMVFLDDESQRAQRQADQALGAYWKALEGTLDPNKVKNAANNALVGSPEEVVEQIKKTFHPEDRLMLWFDFFNHENSQVIEAMQLFKEKVSPRL